jgi:hypothetical protein
MPRERGIEHMGPEAEEFYAFFTRIVGRRGVVLLFRDDEKPTDQERQLARDLRTVLDAVSSR